MGDFSCFAIVWVGDILCFISVCCFNTFSKSPLFGENIWFWFLVAAYFISCFIFGCFSDGFAKLKRQYQLPPKIPQKNCQIKNIHPPVIIKISCYIGDRTEIPQKNCQIKNIHSSRTI